MVKRSYPAPSTEHDWQAKSDMNTLIEARKIKADPKRIKAVIACAQKEKAMLEGVTAYAPEPMEK